MKRTKQKANNEEEMNDWKDKKIQDNLFKGIKNKD